MLKAAVNLRVFYPNLVHITCFSHGLNRVSGKLRGQYPDVNGLISNVKKVFVKAPLRVARFKELLPNKQLPVITRWATWLNAAFYYQENFDAIKEMISTFQDDSIAIKKAKNFLASNTVQADIAYILRVILKYWLIVLSSLK